jgi:hypothetical protein
MDGQLAAGLFKGGDVPESADRQTKVEFGEEGPEILREALSAAVRQGVCVRAPDPDGRCSQRERDDRIRRISRTGVEHHRSGPGGLCAGRSEVRPKTSKSES